MPKNLTLGGFKSEAAASIHSQETITEAGNVKESDLAKIPYQNSNDGDRAFILTHPEGSLPSESLHGLAQANQSHQPLELADIDVPNLVGKSDKMRAICRQIGRVAPTDCTVYVQGESGTGKELVAHAIHFHSVRASRPFVRVNCAALPESLIESELFGHVRGAFTGAVRNRAGRFAQAEKGTILLDEVGSLSLVNQGKLLRVLQEREYEPVGSSLSQSANVRVIATDNHDLGQMVHTGTFREDLFFRLNVFTISMPALRERLEDLPLLLEHFLEKYVHLSPARAPDVSREALLLMQNYHWPGNVRELENAIQRALIVATSGLIEPTNLPLPMPRSVPLLSHAGKGLCLRERLRRCEKQAIEEALARCEGVKKSAAQLLGIDPKNLSHLLRKHGL